MAKRILSRIKTDLARPVASIRRAPAGATTGSEDAPRNDSEPAIVATAVDGPSLGPVSDERPKREPLGSGNRGGSRTYRDTAPIVDPLDFEPGDTDAGSVKRKRGRPPGSGAGVGKTKDETPGALEEPLVQSLLLGVYGMLANLTAIKEFEMDEATAGEASKALIEVQKFYPIVNLSPKAQAWLKLSFVIGAHSAPGLKKLIFDSKPVAAKIVPAPAPAPARANSSAPTTDLSQMQEATTPTTPVNPNQATPAMKFGWQVPIPPSNSDGE